MVRRIFIINSKSFHTYYCCESHINGYKENYNKAISGQPCEDTDGDCSKVSMYCSLDMIAKDCKKTCGKCDETSTETSTNDETIAGISIFCKIIPSSKNSSL